MRTGQAQGLAGLAALAIWCGSAAAQTGAVPACETSKVEVAPAQGVETPAERVARLERALEDSLAQHDECFLALSNSGGSASGSSGTGDGTGDGTANTGTANGQRGAEGQRDTDKSTGATTVASSTNADTPDQELDTSGPPVAGSALDNGAVPSDIPPGLDDDVVAQQIREAAQAETDPDVRARLWDDYRKYKGLPPA